jgi:hypothetical protein
MSLRCLEAHLPQPLRLRLAVVLLLSALAAGKLETVSAELQICILQRALKQCLRTWFAQLTQFKQLLIPFLLTLTP